MSVLVLNHFLLGEHQPHFGATARKRKEPIVALLVVFAVLEFEVVQLAGDLLRLKEIYDVLYLFKVIILDLEVAAGLLVLQIAQRQIVLILEALIIICCGLFVFLSHIQSVEMRNLHLGCVLPNAVPCRFLAPPPLVSLCPHAQTLPLENTIVLVLDL